MNDKDSSTFKDWAEFYGATAMIFTIIGIFAVAGILVQLIYLLVSDNVTIGPFLILNCIVFGLIAGISILRAAAFGRLARKG